MIFGIWSAPALPVARDTRVGAHRAVDTYFGHRAGPSGDRQDPPRTARALPHRIGTDRQETVGRQSWVDLPVSPGGRIALRFMISKMDSGRYGIRTRNHLSSTLGVFVPERQPI
jgi:hypothetical protein